MRILILTHAEVERLLPMPECIEVMAGALATLARGQMHQPLRMVVRPPGAAGLVALMPAYRGGDAPSFGLKAVGVFPGNTALGLDTHQGGVLLFNGQTGELLALMNGAAITAIRTAAVSGVATRLLAREDAGELAILGAGVQARTHLQAMAAVRSLRRCRVAGHRPGSAQKFAAEMQPHYPFPIQAAEDAQAAVRGADLIVTATNAARPVLRREWIAPGAHLNADGCSTPAARELDTATVAAASLFVDRRESALNEAGDYLIAAREGAVGPDHIRAEIGELLLGTRPGRTSPDEITLFKSLGLAVEDLASAEYLYHQARAKNAGAWVEF
ncbi:MAG: ornithine cyclodeaminase family protein [Chloroflexi bacterium]|nr:ornithine cyclodeaminase family protein [Chloroflexota bacterium]